jgi:hypothetical protein
VTSVTAIVAGNSYSPVDRSDESAWTQVNGAQGQLGIDPNPWLPVKTFLA